MVSKSSTAASTAASTSSTAAPGPFSGPTLMNTPFNDKGDATTPYLDRHDLDCGSTAMNSLQLVNNNNGQYQYQYNCESGGSIGTPVDNATPLNDLGGGSTIYLDRHTIDCGTGNVLTRLKFDTSSGNNQIQYKYKCAPVNRQLTCRNVSTTLDSDGGGSTLYLDRHNVSCNPNEALSKVQLSRGADGSTIQYNYTCCA